MRRKGFTLVELLVIIGVITVLTAILLPVFSRARDKARQIDCINNIRQLGLAVRLYNEDWESYPLSIDGLFAGRPVVQKAPEMPGKFFKVWDTFSSTGNYVSWMDFVYPYSRDIKVFECPAASNAQYAGYGYNMAFGGWGKLYYGKDGGGPAPVSFGTPTNDQDIWRASESIMLVDFNHPDSTLCNAYQLRLYGPKSHNEGFNVAFVDGHVKWAPYNDSKIMAGSETFDGSLNNPYWNIFLE